MQMREEIMSVYTARAEQYKSVQKKQLQQIAVLSLLRFLLFVAFAWLLVMAFRSGFSDHYLGGSFLCMAGFLGCVYRAAILKKKNKFLQQLVKINENEKNIPGGIASFLDNGNRFLPPKGVTTDLNVFGPYSLYHLLNRAGSISGREQLAERLSQPFTAPEAIRNYQACVRELSEKIEFRQVLLAQGLLLEEETSLPQLQTGIPEAEFSVFEKFAWRWLGVCWPAGGVAVCIYCIWRNQYSLLLAYLIAGLLLLTVILKKINLLYYHISKRSYLYGQYARCFRLISEEIFTNSCLLQKQADIVHAEHAFDSLSRLTSLFDLRLSMLSFVTNGLFLSDLLCARAYIRWNRRYQADVKGWFVALGEIELLNSLGTFHYNHTSFIFPDCLDEPLMIKATAMGHPLMKPDTAVVNDIAIGDPEQLYLITGSNMSGKSTFLRTLGLNMILAQTGAPVFAETFSFHPVRILTSFHHIDSLEESTSYFYAELKCLQGIIESLPGPVPGLVLLDEVMRGTNSKDKHDGTALLIKKILGYRCLALIATHDTELGSLADAHPGIIGNFCFESELSDDGLVFDFTMRKGIAQTKNATYLMQKMGII